MSSSSDLNLSARADGQRIIEQIDNSSSLESLRPFYQRVKALVEKESDLASFFAYYLTIELGSQIASVSGIKSCYEQCDLHPPSWLASYFSNGLKSKPRKFIRRNSGYRLEEKLREELRLRLQKADRINVATGAEPAGIEYLGVAGSSYDCSEAIEMLLQYGVRIRGTRILTRGNEHCMLLTDDVGDYIAIKSGFSSGYGGAGPKAFSYVLMLLHSHGANIDECEVDELVVRRLDNSALTVSDLKGLEEARPIRPMRWHDYVEESDHKRQRDGTLWMDFPPVMPFAIVDNRIMDLAITFWEGPDDRLLKGYRRLEDVVRDRTESQEHGAKLFSQVFQGSNPKLTWKDVDDAERVGRANLFTGAYMAHRNPRAHKELKSHLDEQISEFLLLNHLFRLEREARRLIGEA